MTEDDLELDMNVMDQVRGLIPTRENSRSLDDRIPGRPARA